MAEEYVKNLTANVTRGWKNIKDATATGRVLTRNVPEWLTVVDRVYNGAKIVDAGRIVEIPEMVETVREAFRLAGLGLGCKQIANRLNGHGKSLSWVTKTLKNRAVLGEFTPKAGELVPNYFPAIISQSEFDGARAQAARKLRNGHTCGNRAKNKADNLFSGLTFDITGGDTVGLYLHKVARGCCLRSVFKANRTERDALREGNRCPGEV
jgi:Recombinase